jgi:hypothetical protein
MAQATWSVEPLPAEAVSAVRAEVGALVERVVDAVEAENTLYGAVLGAPEGMGIRLGIEQAIRSFLDAIEHGEHPRSETAEIWRRLGEAEFQAGRSLDALRGAFRTGTRAAWRGAAELAAMAGVPTPLVISLAEAIFLYTDELAAEVVEGYLRTQSDEAGETERRRRRLATLLVGPDGVEPEVLARAAELARWPLPRRLAVLAVAGQEPGPIGRRLSADPLVGSDTEGVYLVIADPEGPGRRAELTTACGEAVAVLGPSVDPREAARSLHWARLTLGLIERGAIPAERPPVRVEDHLAAVILLADGELARALAGSRLAPLDALPPVDRDRLLETLEGWLDHQRHVPAIAAALHVHPQTVRYRVGKLRELLGERLDTPDGRFELELAVRARRALGRAGRAG